MATDGGGAWGAGASGSVVEAQLDPGKGPVATVLVQNGTLRVGDDYIVGIHSGGAWIAERLARDDGAGIRRRAAHRRFAARRP